MHPHTATIASIINTTGAKVAKIEVDALNELADYAHTDEGYDKYKAAAKTADGPVNRLICAAEHICGDTVRFDQYPPDVQRALETVYTSRAPEEAARVVLRANGIRE